MIGGAQGTDDASQIYEDKPDEPERTIHSPTGTRTEVFLDTQERASPFDLHRTRFPPRRLTDSVRHMRYGGGIRRNARAPHVPSLGT